MSVRKCCGVLLVFAIVLACFSGCAQSLEQLIDQAEKIQDVAEQAEKLGQSVEKGDDLEQIWDQFGGLMDSVEQLTGQPSYSASVADVPAFSKEPYVILNGNEPEFAQEELVTQAYETYSSLDSLGRCGYAMACVGKELMPTKDRESISQIKPSGWVNNAYDFIDGEYLYNRCHLIGFQLTGENANERNLITGTRYMNTQGMLPFENMIADYIKETDNHVLYRVTPIFEGNDLVAKGVQLEAYSVEDAGEGICFHVYVYNVQPGVEIDYATGDNWEAE